MMSDIKIGSSYSYRQAYKFAEVNSWSGADCLEEEVVPPSDMDSENNFNSINTHENCLIGAFLDDEQLSLFSRSNLPDKTSSKFLPSLELTNITPSENDYFLRNDSLQNGVNQELFTEPGSALSQGHRMRYGINDELSSAPGDTVQAVEPQWQTEVPANPTEKRGSECELANDSRTSSVENVLPLQAVLQIAVKNLPVDEQVSTLGLIEPGDVPDSPDKIKRVPFDGNFEESLPSSALADVISSHCRGRGFLSRRYRGKLLSALEPPSEMKNGAAYNPWDRLTVPEQKQLLRELSRLSQALLKRDCEISETRRNSKGLLEKTDSLGRVVSLEDPRRHLRMHFRYDGKSKNVTALVMEDTRTHKTRVYLCTGTDLQSGKREWVGINQYGKHGHFKGEVTVERNSHHVKLEPLSRPREFQDRPHHSTVRRSELSIQRDRLHKAAERAFTSEAAREKFFNDMARFEKVARSRRLSSKEIAAFFKEETKLLNTPSRFVSRESRAKIAREALSHAIEPTGVNQGNFRTCNVTTIEVCMFKRNPSKAMHLITETALTGKFKTASGRIIEPEEKSAFNPVTKGRTLASQIFQEVAVNVHWKGKGKYYHDEGGTQHLRRPGHKEKHGPMLHMNLYPRIYKEIAGRCSETLGIKFGTRESAVNGVENIRSSGELHRKLVELTKKPGGFPIIVRVHTGNPPFFKEAGHDKDGNPGGGHVVTIHGYDARTGKVALDNQWGNRYDHLGRPGDRETGRPW